MFRLFVKEHTLPIDVYRSKEDADSFVSSFSTTTRVQIEPITGQTSWIGGRIIITSGSMTSLGSTIVGEGLSGGTLSYVDVVEAFPVPPFLGSEFMLVRRNLNSISFPIHNYKDLSKYISSISYDTDVDIGFDTATVELNQMAISLARFFSQLTGMYAEIQDVFGHRCFSGIIVGASLDGQGGNLRIIGHGNTFGWFIFDGTYTNASTGTSTKIIRDVCALNPFIARTYDYTVDRNNVWHIAQEAIGGIVPQDFSSPNTKGSDVLKQVLSLGYYGISEQKVSVQVWHDCVPELKILPLQENLEPEYLISDKNIAAGFEGIAIDGDINDFYSYTFASYTDSDNHSLPTVGSYNLPAIRRSGFRARYISGSSGGGVGEATAMVSAARRDYQTIAGPGGITLVGKIKRKGSGHYLPVHLLKAGNVIAFESNIGLNTLYANNMSNPGIFVIGHTSYNSDDGSVNITPMKPILMSELFDSRIDI